MEGERQNKPTRTCKDTLFTINEAKNECCNCRSSFKAFKIVRAQSKTLITILASRGKEKIKEITE